MPSPLLSVEQLNNMLAKQPVLLLDVSVDKVVGKTPIVYSEIQTIPGSVHLDINKHLVDESKPGVHNFPTREQVQQVLISIGFTGQPIILFDNQGIYSAPRAWWILQSFGLSNIFILDGGYPAWRAEGFETSNQYSKAIPALTSADLSLQVNCLTDKNDILNNLDTKQFTVVDVRSESRFQAKEPEPRSGIRSGHIPNSINLPFANVLSEFQYKDKAALKSLFNDLNVDLDQPLVFSCGSGVTACIVIVAAIIAGVKTVSLYDGSWSEWGAEHDLPIEA